MLYIKWTLIYLAIPICYLLLIDIALIFAPEYDPIMFSVPILLTLVLVIGLIISTVKQEKLNNK